MNITVNLLSVNIVTGWSATFFVTSTSEATAIGDDSLKICPGSYKENSISLIPLQRNEAYRYTFEDKRGLDIQFLKLNTTYNNP